MFFIFLFFLQRCLTFLGKLLQLIKVKCKNKLTLKAFLGIRKQTRNKPVWFSELKTKPKTKEFSFLKAKLNQKQMDLVF
jgi:hypothetical protein